MADWANNKKKKGEETVYVREPGMTGGSGRGSIQAFKSRVMNAYPNFVLGSEFGV